MIKFYFLKNYIYFFFFILLILISFSTQNAKEILIYADEILYDTNENIIGKGKAKIIYENQIIKSELIIYDKINNKVILPISFEFKDNNDNLYYGSEGLFYNDLENGSVENIKMFLPDGSRIVGDKYQREGDIDIISKGVYSPCTSKIKIGNFICPIWQLEGEKILHDNKNLFLYQKHSKMRVLNTPVFYTPYIVTPSPLRKKRKSGFLNPTISFKFFDTKVSQNTSLPYYFNISEDKELTLIPSINYGGGVDSSQQFIFDYNQLISGGTLSTDVYLDTKFEEQNNNKWFSDASIVTDYSQNINTTYSLDFNSAVETSKNYIQSTNPNNDLSYTSSLSTALNLKGHNLKKIDDKLLVNFSTYQTNQNNDDNSSIPTVLPFITYNSGSYKIKTISYDNNFEFYNIFRDKKTSEYAKEQQKISHNLYFTQDFINFNSNISFSGVLYNQFYNTIKKDIKENEIYTGNNIRSFPILGVEVNTPFRLTENFFDFIYTPSLSLILSPGKSNSEKISNEDSSLNLISGENEKSLNRYTGSDRLDNSKRLVSAFSINNKKLKANLTQSYEFTNNSNYHKDVGNKNNLSNLLGNVNFKDTDNELNYSMRYDHYKKYLKEQNITLDSNNKFGTVGLSYLDQKSESDGAINNDIETLNYSFSSKKIKKYSKINFSGLYNLKTNINTEYGLGYSYFDECFGINIDFSRKSYKEDDLKPQDTLTIMFSFKNLGSYKSTNLAVSEYDKQDIRWESSSVNNDAFN